LHQRAGQRFVLCAKLGPDRIAGNASRAVSAITSVMNLCVPCSMPLAQATTGVALPRCGARVLTAARKFCAGVAIRMMSAVAARAMSPVTATLASNGAPGNFGLVRVAAIPAARSGWRA
jgi:hypothetical protein